MINVIVLQDKQKQGGQPTQRDYRKHEKTSYQKKGRYGVAHHNIIVIFGGLNCCFGGLPPVIPDTNAAGDRQAEMFKSRRSVPENRQRSAGSNRCRSI